jgi:heme iron utilization protein
MLDTEIATLKSLLLQPVASLATLHAGDPALSMVPFALMPDGQGVVIHVSQLASHTQDMTTNPAVALLIMAPNPSTTPLALPRLSLQGVAAPCLVESPQYRVARNTYLARLPEAEDLFSFSDFSLFIITPTHLRFIAGFGRAISLSPERLKSILE